MAPFGRRFLLVEVEAIPAMPELPLIAADDTDLPVAVEVRDLDVVEDPLVDDKHLPVRVPVPAEFVCR